MRKRVFSLCMVFALCFLLLPIPALADEVSASAASVMEATEEPERGESGNATFLETKRTSAAQNTGQDEDVQFSYENGKNCHEMTELWFGDSSKVALMDASEVNTPEDILSVYFSMRVADYPGNTPVTPDMETLLSDEVKESGVKRSEGIANYKKNQNLIITDAEVSVQIDSERTVYNSDGTIVFYVYEWTFFDYDDLSDGVGGSDVAGHGVYHRITLGKTNGNYLILSDEYDESDSFGVCTLSAGQAADWPTLSESNSADTDSEKDVENTATLQAAYSYNVADAVAYANTHDKSYNSAYTPYPGNDCANFVSQCLEAGGIPRDNTWRPGSSAWVNTYDLLNYMVNQLGGTLYTTEGHRNDVLRSNIRIANMRSSIPLTNSIMEPGMVVWMNGSAGTAAHVAICTKKNSAGTPLFSAHTTDRHEEPWSAGTFYYAVKLNGGAHGHHEIQKGSPDATCVRELQKMLNKVINAGLDEDGEFGDGTEAALKKYQTLKNLTVDGVCGENTWRELDADYNNGTNVAVGKPTLNVNVNNATVTFSWEPVSNAAHYDIERR